MKEYKRELPLFSLCGLNCGLCPRYHTDGSSRCPGCGGPDFYEKHPSCAVINCNLRHDDVEFCYQCSLYPCEKYQKESTADSFITYRKVREDFQKAAGDLELYKAELSRRMEILRFLLDHFNEGRKKNYYCIAVNLLSLEALERVFAVLENLRAGMTPEIRERAKTAAALLEKGALAEGIRIELRK
jgi:hypothetical protein